MAMTKPFSKAQSVVRTCEEHELKEISCFCKTCETFICILCGQTTHHGHVWDLITSIAWEYRKETPKLCRRLKEQNLPQCREKLRGMDIVHKTAEKKKKEELKKLEEKRSAIINMVNHAIDKQKRKMNELARNVKAMMEKERREQQQNLENLEKLMLRLDTNIADYKDYSVIEMERDMLKTLKEVESYDMNIATSSIKFLPEELNKELIKKINGVVDETAMTSVDDFEDNPLFRQTNRETNYKEFHF